MAADSPGMNKKGLWNKDNETLPDALNEIIQPNDIIHIIMEEIVLERECELFLIGEKYYKAISIVLPSSDDGFGEIETFSFGNLNVRQLRKAAGSLGVRNSSRMLKDRITIGQLSKIGGVVNGATASLQPEVGAGCQTKRVSCPKKTCMC
jgi:hypothetical protein